MTEVFFYLVKSDQSFEHIRRLLVRSREAGWRTIVRAGSDSAIDSLDRQLWTHPPESFLPHAVAGGEFDEDQSILLTTDENIESIAESLILFDGARVKDDAAAQYQRVSIVCAIDHESEVENSRAQWSRLSKAGTRLQYWAFENGKWNCQAQKNYPSTDDVTAASRSSPENSSVGG
ncbi:MAG: DNA polymerase III subunit chi [Rhodobacteraceae bacterium]|nr:DNA polymerase III subunit chi [Paracoccaceae bacterium]